MLRYFFIVMLCVAPVVAQQSGRIAVTVTDPGNRFVTGLDEAGVQIIEVTHGDGLAGSSFNYGFSGTDELTLIRTAVESATRARIADGLANGLVGQDTGPR